MNFGTQFGVAVVGRSEAGKRILQAGLDYERRQREAEKAARAEVNRLNAIQGALDGVPQAAAPEPAAPPPYLSPCRAVLAAVAEEHGLTVADLVSAGRGRALVRARHHAMYRCVVETTASLPQIGRIIGKDHTTVLNGVRMHCRRNNLPMPRGMTQGTQTMPNVEPATEAVG